MKSNSFLKKSSFISFGWICILLFIATVPSISIAQDLLEQYIHSKGDGTIVFNSSNIKQYWIDKSVLSQNGVIQIQLTKGKKFFESVPLKIQLANVTADQDCEVEVITENDGVNFQILNEKSTIISNENSSNPLGRYRALVSKFHMEDASGLAFFMKFNSANNDPIAIKSIVLSFSKNNLFLDSPGVLKYNKDNLLLKGGTFSSSNDSSFSITGERNYCNSKNRIVIQEAPIITSATIKNIGEQTSKIQFGYTVYTQNSVPLGRKLLPYKNPGSDVLEVVSSEKNSPQIVVNTYSEYQKGSFLALNAKDDLSDLPNTSFADGSIVEITKNDDGSAVITMSEPQKVALKKGMLVRIHGIGTNSNINIYQKILLPGEEEHIDHTMKKDETVFRSTKAFPKGTYYVVPFVNFLSEEKGKDCSIQLSDYSISY